MKGFGVGEVGGKGLVDQDGTRPGRTTQAGSDVDRFTEEVAEPAQDGTAGEPDP